MVLFVDLSSEFDILSNISSSIVFFVSAKKFNKIIPLIKNFFLNRKIVVCREITKFYEEFIRLDVKNLDVFSDNLKGEITVVISDEEKTEKNSFLLSESDKYVISKLINKISIKDICKIVDKENRIKKSLIYNYCLTLKKWN